MACRLLYYVGEGRPGGGEVSLLTRAHHSLGPCWQGENILQVELDMPNRTTRDYEGPTVAPRVQAALDAALQDEEDIYVDGRYGSSFKNHNQHSSNLS